MGKFHFWVTFLGAYAIFFPIHYLGLMGVPRRYYELGETAFIPVGPHPQRLRHGRGPDRRLRSLVFLFNLIWSLFKGRPAGGNPLARHAGADAGDAAGPRQLGQELPVVYRWAYDYSVPGAAQDFIPQNEPPAVDRPRGTAVAITAAFLAVVAVIVGWWLSHQRLAAKPWLELGVIGDLPDAGVPRVPAAKIGLGVFLAVAGSLFALFASAYTDARTSGHGLAAMPVPPLLWLNTQVCWS